VPSTATVYYGCAVPIYALGDQIPNIHPDAYVHPDAVVIGSVTIGAQSTVWPCAVLRGDDGEIRIGARTSIQDGSVIHTTTEQWTIVGDGCVIGHLVHLEGCTIHDDALVGNGSIVLHRAVVHSGAVVAANSVVLQGTIVPTGALAVGVPAVVREGKAKSEFTAFAAAGYVLRGQQFKTALRRID
jgi:carbonic anhydrase/acetyltransferase-like protein (isoleucine patch superfamily)